MFCAHKHLAGDLAILPDHLDADGNLLTTDDGWSYTWNAENRLIKAEQGTVKLEFAYDYMGRRYAKKVYAGETLTKHQRFVYDGYKLLGIYDMLNNGILIADFVWQPESVGLDVPLCMTYNAVKYFFIVDGNKNVIGLVDSTGTRVATYIYGPFGEILSMTGDMAEINPFRFSSEFHDDETGLVYYNYRYYSPRLGRWTKRDEIDKQDVLNLYLLGTNAAINLYDRLGLWWSNIHHDATNRWAKMLKYTAMSAEVIATSDDEVDLIKGWKGPWPILGNQGYHFDRSLGGYDTRLQYRDKHLNNAKTYCNKNYARFDPELAAKELGVALHPAQDWIAHADYSYSEPNAIVNVHNSCSLQFDYGNPADYPDLPNLDVKNSPDGRALRRFLIPNPIMIGITTNSKPSEYAIYELGFKRYNLTREKTNGILNDFKYFLLVQGSKRCKCYFLGES